MRELEVLWGQPKFTKLVCPLCPSFLAQGLCPTWTHLPIFSAHLVPKLPLNLYICSTHLSFWLTEVTLMWCHSSPVCALYKAITEGPAPSRVGLLTTPPEWFFGGQADSLGNRTEAKEDLWMTLRFPGPFADSPPTAVVFPSARSQVVLWRQRTCGLGLTCPGTLQATPREIGTRKWRFRRQIIDTGPLGLRKKRTRRRTEFLQLCIWRSCNTETSKGDRMSHLSKESH